METMAPPLAEPSLQDHDARLTAGGAGCPGTVPGEEASMTMVVTALSTSVDGFIAGADDGPEQPLGIGGQRLFKWYSDGDTPSRYFPSFKLSAASAKFFDEGASRVGAVIAGRRTYDISDAWGGTGPMPGVPLFVLTHRVPETVPSGDPPYTFVTEGIERRAAMPAGRPARRVHDPPGAGAAGSRRPPAGRSRAQRRAGARRGGRRARRHAPDLPGPEVGRARRHRRG